MTPSRTTQPPADLVITGCTALMHDEQEQIGFVEDAVIVVRGGVIASVGQVGGTTEVPPPSASTPTAR